MMLYSVIQRTVLNLKMGDDMSSCASFPLLRRALLAPAACGPTYCTSTFTNLLHLDTYLTTPSQRTGRTHVAVVTGLCQAA